MAFANTATTDAANIRQNIHEYTAKACEISLTTNSSSSFEAAMKLAYHLHERGLISTTKSTSEIFDLTNGDRLLYDAFHLNNKPVAELRCIFKNPQSLYGDEMSNDDSTLENTATNDTFPFDFDHNKDVLDSTLLHYFGFESFRPLQRETIESTLKGENVMTVVGTGGGKSMMYLLPAVLASKPSLVVSPTKSLIDDLLLRCGTLEIPACKFTADVPKDTQDI